MDTWSYPYRLGMCVLMALLSAAAVAQRLTVVHDHEDSPASATVLTLGQIATGSIEPRGDLDYYRFDLPGRMDVTVSSTADAGTDFWLLDENSRDLGYLTQDDGHGRLRVRALLDAGRYYLIMMAYGEELESINYEVLIHETPPDDHGNTETEATAIVLGDAAAGEIDPHDDVDYFRLELDRRATVVVAGTGVADFWALTDADDEVLSNSEWIPERSELQLRGDLDPGTYYIAVRGYGDADQTTGRYEIVAREAEPDDHGDRPDTATVVVPGRMAQGTVDRWDDVDYYRLDLTRPSVLAVSVTSDFENIELTLFDAEGALLQEGYGVARTDLRTRAELAPGTYYVSVASYLSVNSYSYTHMGSCYPPPFTQRTGRYRLSVWDVPNDDHGGLVVTATDWQHTAFALREIGRFGGVIDPREDRDVFRLEIARPTDLIVDVIGGFPPLARIFNADGEEMDAGIAVEDGSRIWEQEVTVSTELCDDWTMKLVQPNSEEGELQMRFEAQPGVYYLELRSEGGAGWYSVNLREPGPEDF